MPIYAYRCEACGFAKDVLQKYSDPQLTVCLSCGAPAFKKQVTAAGFQLKGTGWYATDFRNGAGTTAPAVANAGEGGEPKKADAGKGDKAAGGADKGGSSNTGSSTGSSSDKPASGASAGTASDSAGAASTPKAGGGAGSAGGTGGTPSSAA